MKVRIDAETTRTTHFNSISGITNKVQVIGDYGFKDLLTGLDMTSGMVVGFDEAEVSNKLFNVNGIVVVPTKELIEDLNHNDVVMKLLQARINQNLDALLADNPDIIDNLAKSLQEKSPFGMDAQMARDFAEMFNYQ